MARPSSVTKSSSRARPTYMARPSSMARSSAMAISSSMDEYVMVAAIDFGTTFSGYAFSLRATRDNKTLHEQIRMNSDWGQGLGFQSYKTATSVLTKELKDGRHEFEDFGFDAEKKYCQAVQAGDGKAHNLHLFRHFKMMLHDSQRKSKKDMVTSINGTIAPATDIFSFAIKYMKDHLLNVLRSEHSTYDDGKLIRWVITVPAIWSDHAKGFMRNAAYKAGCITSKTSDQLIIALEPEAASLCCRRFNIAQYSSVAGITFKQGTSYLIVDCGGGTVDITSHMLDENGRACELSVPSGGPWGGKQVDQNLIDFLGTIFGRNFMNKYQKEVPKEWLEMHTHFEIMKKDFKADGKSRIGIPIRYNFGELCDDELGQSVKKILTKNSGKGAIFVSGEIVIQHQQALALFEPVITKIIDHLRDLLLKPELKLINYIFLVGGFSECAVLQNEVKKAFGGNGLKILTPSSAQLAVVKGAVLYGHEPQAIKTRRARFTYGSGVNAPFNPDIHDRMYRFIDNRGSARCDDIFNVYIEQGEEITIGSNRKFKVNAPVDSIEETISLLRLDGPPNKPVQYINVAGISDLGQIKLSTPVSKQKREMEVTLDFGGTEIGVSAVFTATGEKVSAKFNFSTY